MIGWTRRRSEEEFWVRVLSVQGFYARITGVTAALDIDMADSVQWTTSAEALLIEIPFFVRPAARKKIEKYARENGLGEITEAVYEQAKAQFGRKK